MRVTTPRGRCAWKKRWPNNRTAVVYWLLSVDHSAFEEGAHGRHARVLASKTSEILKAFKLATLRLRGYRHGQADVLQGGRLDYLRARKAITCTFA